MYKIHQAGTSITLLICLRMFQAKMRESTVIIVGTHIDQIPTRRRKERCETLERDIRRFYGGATGNRAFPSIKGIHFIGCPPGKRGGINVDVLNDSIFDVAVNMTVPQCK